jgi:hypothetical protein
LLSPSKLMEHREHRRMDAPTAGFAP